MNINCLISLVETIEQNSISKAAKNLHMTQSALSQQLQALEKSLNSQILIRSNKGVTLTSEGEIALAYAETIISLYKNMLKELDQSKKSVITEIKIISCNSVGEYLLPCTLHLYKKNHSNVKFNLKNENTKNIAEYITNCSADIGFIDTKIHIEGIECINMFTGNLVFIFSPQNNDIKNDVISLNDIFKLPLILLSKENMLRQIIDSMFIDANISLDNLNIDMELDTIESIKASVLANNGVSIVPYTSVKKELHTNSLKTISIKDSLPKYNICMIYQKNRSQQIHIKEFIAYMKKYGYETFC